jgi:hypothetical protein
LSDSNTWKVALRYKTLNPSATDAYGWRWQLPNELGVLPLASPS